MTDIPVIDGRLAPTIMAMLRYLVRLSPHDYATQSVLLAEAIRETGSLRGNGVEGLESMLRMGLAEPVRVKNAMGEEVVSSTWFRATSRGRAAYQRTLDASAGQQQQQQVPVVGGVRVSDILPRGVSGDSGGERSSAGVDIPGQVEIGDVVASSDDVIRTEVVADRRERVERLGKTRSGRIMVRKSRTLRKQADEEAVGDGEDES